jgi:hypothetical protein
VNEDLASEVRERDVGARRAQVGDEQVAGVGAEAEQPRRTTSRRWPKPVLGEKAVVEQRLDILRDDRPPEAGGLDQARPGGRPVQANVVEHRDEGVRGGGRRSHRLYFPGA